MSKLESIIEIKDEDRRFELLYNVAVLNHLPVALWRKPNQIKKHAIVSFTNEIENTNLDLKNCHAGFVFSPFEDSNNKSFFIRSDFYLHDHICSICNSGRERTYLDKTLRANLESTLARLYSSNSNGSLQKGNDWYRRNSSQSIPITKKEEFCGWVKEALAEINRSGLKKVVFSRTLEIALKPNFSAFTMFKQLCSVYPTAFVSLVALPGIGTWIGATPELLLSLDDHRLTTVALAGTKEVDLREKNAHKIWGNKEIVEQEIVSEYIRDCFKQHDIYDFKESGPETVRIGSILHLQTKFVWRHSLKNRMALVSHFLRSLHPTPAVCGVPKGKALKFIAKLESHDREFYAGFLGPVNLENESHLFANLRCLQLLKHSAILYAGGGITRDSNPQQEWLETKLKLDALLRIINGTAEFSDDIISSAKWLEGAVG